MGKTMAKDFMMRAAARLAASTDDESRRIFGTRSRKSVEMLGRIVTEMPSLAFPAHVTGIRGGGLCLSLFADGHEIEIEIMPTGLLEAFVTAPDRNTPDLIFSTRKLGKPDITRMRAGLPDLGGISLCPVRRVPAGLAVIHGGVERPIERFRRRTRGFGGLIFTGWEPFCVRQTLFADKAAIQPLADIPASVLAQSCTRRGLHIEDNGDGLAEVGTAIPGFMRLGFAAQHAVA